MGGAPPDAPSYGHFAGARPPSPLDTLCIGDAGGQGLALAASSAGASEVVVVGLKGAEGAPGGFTAGSNNAGTAGRQGQAKARGLVEGVKCPGCPGEACNVVRLAGGGGGGPRQHGGHV